MLHEVIPMMDILNKELETAFNNEKHPLVVRHGIQHALVVLDKYYSKVDYSLMWKTSMCMLLSVVECLLINFILVLHPKYCYHYFERELWEQAWIDTAVSAAWDVWNKYYRTHATVSLPSISHSNSSNLFAALHAPHY